MKLLLVDDSTVMRRMMKNQLGQLGVTDTVEASNGQEALEVLASNMPVDIILLDWNMPVMDGMTFLKTVRADNTYKDVKIVMCTSESEKSKVIVAMKEGVNNYIVKPFTPEALQEKLGL
ncbi:MAG: response regulator [Chitinivibrionales bacterium]|nr:response regulator [Chitinivibrionales bacterium]